VLTGLRAACCYWPSARLSITCWRFTALSNIFGFFAVCPHAAIPLRLPISILKPVRGVDPGAYEISPVTAGWTIRNTN